MVRFRLKKRSGLCEKTSRLCEQRSRPCKIIWTEQMNTLIGWIKWTVVTKEDNFWIELEKAGLQARKDFV